MRISDWSSDVCSSDLGDIGELQSVATASRGEVGDHVIALIAGQREAENVSAAAAGQGIVAVAAGQRVALLGAGAVVVAGGPGDAAAGLVFILGIRSEERREGKECAYTGKSRESPSHST